MPFGTLRPPGRIRELKRTVTTTCLIVTVTALTGCGFLPFTEKKNTQTPAPMPPQYSETASPPEIPAEGMVNSAEQSSNAPTDIPANIPVNTPEGYKQVPAPPPPALTPPIDPLVAAGRLQLGEDGPMGSLGVNFDEYFDDQEEIETRIKKVERAVTAIQGDLKTLAPPIKRLITVERDIQELVSQLAEFVQTPPAPATMEPVDASHLTSPITAPQSLYATAPANAPVMAAQRTGSVISGGKTMAGSSGSYIKALRTGEHRDKTRIVLDASGPASYRYDLDNTEQLLVIELPNVNWSGKNSETFKKSPLISSYNVYSLNGGGSRVVMQLKKNTSVSYESSIKPNKHSSNYRIVLDLKK